MPADIFGWSRTPADNDDADTGINWLEGQPPSTVNNSSRQMMARVAEFLADVGATQTTGGSANAHTITARSSYTAYARGLYLRFKAGFSNTGATTLNVNGIGAKAIRKIAVGGDAALVADDIIEDGIYTVVYDDAANSAAGAWILLNPSQVVSTRMFFHVDDYGAVGTATADDSTAIQAAIAAAGAAGGGIVRFSAKVYGIASDIVINSHNVFLLGEGTSWFSNKNASAVTAFSQFGGTVIRALSGCTNMVTFRPVYDNVTGTRLMGGGMDGIVLECNSIAAKGLVVESMAGGMFPFVVVDNPTTIGLHLTVTGEENLPDVNRVTGIGATGTYEEPRDTQHCIFGKTLVRCWQAGSLSADCIVLDGDDEADVSLVQFQDIFYVHYDGVGLDIYSSDACRFGLTFGFRIAGGSGTGIQINGGASVTDFPRHHLFEFCQPGPGGLDIVANTVKPNDIAITFYSRGNGTPAATFDDGCRPTIIQESSGINVAVIDDADGRTLINNDIGALFTNSGASGRADFSLPGAVAGYRVGFTCSDANGIRVIAGASDTIRLGTTVSASAGRIDSTDVGSTVWLTCVDATEWRADTVTGIWTVT